MFWGTHSKQRTSSGEVQKSAEEIENKRVGRAIENKAEIAREC
jgi:hypothetical protein